jgi:hypothetical protein
MRVFQINSWSGRLTETDNLFYANHVSTIKETKTISFP